MSPSFPVNSKLISGCVSFRTPVHRCLALNTNASRASSLRRYAQVGTTTFVGEPPSPPSPPPRPVVPSPTPPPPTPPTTAVKAFDARVLSELGKYAPSDTSPQTELTPLPELVDQYMKRAGHMLDVSLPYESRPDAGRCVRFSNDAKGTVVSTADKALVMVAHAVHDRTGTHKITYSSGFAIRPPGTPENENVVLTCAHTLEEIQHDPLMRAGARLRSSVPSSSTSNELRSGAFVISGSSDPIGPTFHPVSSILSAMHRSDLLLLSSPSASDSALRSLPINPYPVHPGTPIRTHFVADQPPTNEADRDGWTPWIGGTWRKWIKGTVVGYRDYAGREAKPGTYDSLAHLHFDPPPTPGSSGGPIIDEESGSVIGVVLGTQLVNQVEGTKGWGVPAEMIFEMFTLPGLKLKSRA